MRRTVVFVVILLVLGFGSAAFVSWDGPHRGGDPGGLILRELGRVASALPRDAVVASDQRHEPTWDSCDGLKGTFGWTDVGLQIHFSTATPAQQLLDHADQAMYSAGWQRTREGWWSVQLVNGTTASATLEPPSYDGGWTLRAFAPPVGQSASGC